MKKEKKGHNTSSFITDCIQDAPNKFNIDSAITKAEIARDSARFRQITDLSHRLKASHASHP